MRQQLVEFSMTQSHNSEHYVLLENTSSLTSVHDELFITLKPLLCDVSDTSTFLTRCLTKQIFGLIVTLVAMRNLGLGRRLEDIVIG